MSVVRPLALLLLMLPLVGCPSEEPDPTPTPATPVVTVAGTHAVQIGATLQLSATTADGTDAGYTWASSDAAIAAVDATGLVTGVAVGEVQVTATGDDTAAAGSHAIVVTAEPVTLEPTVAVGGAFYVLVGDTATLTVATANGTDSAYTWAVDNDSVATVDEAGVLSALNPGEVVVTATGADTGASGTLGVVVATEIPHLEEWSASAHADITSEAFRRWDDDGAISTSCARCHSSEGYLDYLGADGSAVGTVDAEGPTGSVIRCETCHDPAAVALDSVTFPSGDVVEGLGAEARCMTCHQGRSSKVTVDTEITDAAVVDDDTIDEDLGFINIHYYAAGATVMAGLARGGYEYDEEVYDTRFRHVSDPNSCVECHSPHSLEVQVDTCATCHEGVTDLAGLKDVRMMASASVDFDGDGNLTEGIYYELIGVRDIATTALLAYATEKGNPVCYDGDAYPYFFNDTDADGACDSTEASYGNRYASWTARMLRGAYNIQVATKDPGAYAHNAKYVIELLYDSATDLNGALGTPADLSGLTRNDPGHFNGSSDAARHWDDDDDLSANCSKCHGGSEGLHFYLEHGVGNAVPEQANGLDCETCHTTFANVDNAADAYSVVEVTSYELPNGMSFSEPDDASNLCATCHSGRKTGADVDATLAGSNPRFQNVHYYPAAGVRRGGDGHIGYEYGTNAYSGPADNHLAADGCVFCHAPGPTGHSFQPSDSYAAGECAPCHTAAGAVGNIRGATIHGADYDGDGSATETLAAELDTMAAAVLTKLNEVGGICYASSSYPYFFSGAAGVCTSGEASYGNRFQGWGTNDALLKAAYNYQVWSKDPGAWAHNFDYMAQLLYDSYADLGGDPATAGWVRPTP